MKGVYKPKNTTKYKGDPTNIVYRSSWELKFMRWCDETSSVIEWSSETIVVPYRSKVDELIEKKKKLNYKIMHRYFVDFYVKLKTKDGTIKRWLVEVKPYSQTIEPVKPDKAKNSRSYTNALLRWWINDAKWKAAREYAADRNMEFRLITEKELYGK